MPDKCYTYRNGKKLALKKRPDCFIIRALSDDLKKIGLPQGEQVSTASTRIVLSSENLESSMSIGRGIAPTHHAYQTVDTNQDFLITDRIFITFKKDTSKEDIEILAGKNGLWLLELLSDRDFLYQVSNNTGMNPVKLVVQLMENEGSLVELVEHDLNYTSKMYQIPFPTDSSYIEQWHLHKRMAHELFDKRASSRCEEAWELLNSFGNAQIVVGVTDDGCNLSHHDFNSQNKFAGWGYFEKTTLLTNRTTGSIPDKMYSTNNNHGTSCAGVIAGEADAELTVGAAPGCRLLPIKWPIADNGGLYIGDIRMLRMLNFLGDKVDIISNSWGNSPRSNVNDLVKNKISQLAQNGGRRGKGILFLWAAGNENCPIQHNSTIDVPYSNGIKRVGSQYFWEGVKTAREFRHNLVGIPGVMFVAAIASVARRSHYSNYGTGIDISAPSSNSHTYWRGHAPGLEITTTTGSHNSGITSSFGGTSSATPLIAGVAALIISANPELTAIEVSHILKKTASKDLDKTAYSKTTPSNFDPDTSWDVSPIAPFDSGSFQDSGDDLGTWSPWFGYGCVNAHDAVKMAFDSGNPSHKIRCAQDSQLEIPDNAYEGIVSEVEITKAGKIRDIRVRVDITHPYIGDLFLELINPADEKITFHNRIGGSQDNLRITFDTQNTPNLSRLINSNIQGIWKLKVADRAGWDVGMLNRWVLIAEIS